MNWRHKALCRDMDPELFFPFPGQDEQLADAKAVCRDCPVATQCLEFALANGLDHGVFGGMSEDERRALRVRRARTA
jgi:WhiB family transcriptional regulator, redox-sensing transcriptional regulator